VNSSREVVFLVRTLFPTFQKLPDLDSQSGVVEHRFQDAENADLRRSNLVIESACGAVAAPKATAPPALFRVLKCLSFRLG